MNVPEGWTVAVCGCCLVPPWGLDEDEPGWDEDEAQDWVDRMAAA